jgi:hypothetical protein
MDPVQNHMISVHFSTLYFCRNFFKTSSSYAFPRLSFILLAICFQIKVTSNFVTLTLAICTVGSSLFDYINFILYWPHHGSSAQSLASYHGGLGSSPCLIMWDLWWTKWRFGVLCQSSFHQILNPHNHPGQVQ